MISLLKSGWRQSLSFWAVFAVLPQHFHSGILCNVWVKHHLGVSMCLDCWTAWSARTRTSSSHCSIFYVFHLHGLHTSGWYHGLSGKSVLHANTHAFYMLLVFKNSFKVQILAFINLNSSFYGDAFWAVLLYTCSERLPGTSHIVIGGLCQFLSPHLLNRSWLGRFKFLLSHTIWCYGIGLMLKVSAFVRTALWLWTIFPACYTSLGGTKESIFPYYLNIYTIWIYVPFYRNK